MNPDRAQLAALSAQPDPIPDTGDVWAAKREWATLNLYDAVMSVRAGLDGSADPMDPEEARAILSAVRARVWSWRPTAMPSPRREADYHLRWFLKYALSECESRLMELP